MLEVIGVLSGTSKAGTQAFKPVVNNFKLSRRQYLIEASRLTQVYTTATELWNLPIPTHLDI